MGSVTLCSGRSKVKAVAGTLKEFFYLHRRAPRISFLCAAFRCRYASRRASTWKPISTIRHYRTWCHWLSDIHGIKKIRLIISSDGPCLSSLRTSPRGNWINDWCTVWQEHHQPPLVRSAILCYNLSPSMVWSLSLLVKIGTRTWRHGMKILRWMADFMQLDHICNYNIQQRCGFVAVAIRLRQACFQWPRSSCRWKHPVQNWPDLDKFSEWPKGRPKQLWLNTLHDDLKLAVINFDQV